MSYLYENLLAEPRVLYFNALSSLLHCHSHVMIIYPLTGSSVVTINEQDYLLEAGDICLTFPYQLISCHDRCNCQGFILSMPNNFHKELKDLFRKNIPSSPIIKKESIPTSCRSLIHYMTKKRLTNNYLDAICIRGAMLSLFGEVLSLMTLIPQGKDLDIFRTVLIYCGDHFLEPLTLDILADECHMNKYYLSHLFNKRVGLSIPAFINNLRIKHACELLDNDCPITDSAFASGFNSLRTFNRAFAEIMGMSPRDYLKHK